MANEYIEELSQGARGDVQYDEQGRPYLLLADGRRYYVQPEDTSDRAAGGFWRGAGHWNPETADWERGGINGGNLLSLGVGGLLTGGALSAAGAFGGAAGGASGAAGGGGAGGGATAGVAGGNLPWYSALGAESAVPGAGMVSGAGMGAAAGMGMSAATGPGMGSVDGIGSQLLNQGVKTALPLGMMAAGRVLGGGGQGQIPPELQQILDLQKQRMQLQNPLFEAISRLAMSRLPTAQQQAMSGEQGVDPVTAAERLSRRGRS